MIASMSRQHSKIGERGFESGIDSGSDRSWLDGLQAA